MTGGFEVDAELLGGKAAEVEGLAERAAGIAADLTAALERSGTAWGDDAVGRSFAAAHGGPAEETVGVLAGLSGELSELGGSLGGAATRYQETEADAARRFAPETGD